MRSTVFFAVSVALVIAGFQNCSEPMSGDAGSGGASSLAVATPTPAPLSGTYSPNPAVVGNVISVYGLSGKPPYTFVKTSGNGSLNGQYYTAPASPETATITVVDTAGQSYPITIQVYASTPSPTPTPSPSPTPSPTPRPTVPVYRFYNPSTLDHFFSLDQNDPTAVGWNRENIGFYVYPQQGSGMIPLYRCHTVASAFKISKHFVSLVQDCSDFLDAGTMESVLGYIYAQSTTGHVRLYRVVNTRVLDSLATKDPNEGAGGGYAADKTYGYVTQ